MGILKITYLIDLLALTLAGHNRHKPVGPPSCTTPREPTIYAIYVTGFPYEKIIAPNYCDLL